MKDMLFAVPLLLVLALAAPLPAQSAPLETSDEVITGVLDNGLRYYVRENSEPPNRAELRLAVNVGSLLEDDDQLGLAHFVEHMAFNGTESFAAQELVDYLERTGMRFGPDVNAYTSFDETVYMLTLPTDSLGVLETGVQILSEWAGGITLDSLEIEKERGVVVEEWRLGQGAAARLRDEQLPVLVRGSRYAERLPIGSREALESFEHDALRRFYHDWYRPDLMAVVAVGDFDAEWMVQLIHDRFSTLTVPDSARDRQEYGIPPHEDTRVSVASDPEATRTDVRLYLKSPPNAMSDEASYRGWLVELLASNMLISRLNDLIHHPDAPFLDVSSFHGRFLRPLSVYMIDVRTREERVGEGLETLLTEVRRAAEHGFAETEIEREKREMLRGMEQRFLERQKETSSSHAGSYVSHYLYGGSLLETEAEWRLYERLLPSIELNEVRAVARNWGRRDNRVLLVTMPTNAQVGGPSESQIRDLMDSVGDQRLARYDDDLSDALLLPEPPAGSPVVSERRIEEVDITEWTLGNGVRVLVKPTDYREDQVLIAARSPGGHSLVPDADFVPALTATAVVQAGGLGELDVIQLRKRLAGHTAGVGMEIGRYHEGLAGAASVADLEMLFQLTYLKFTEPRVDTSAFVTYREQAIASMRNRSASPEVVLGDTLRALLSQYHPRSRAPTAEMFDSMDLTRSFEIFTDRFADASDFTFYIVGAVETESLRPLVERYLGGLPSTGRQETWRDLEIVPPAGVVRRTLHRGIDPEKARTQVVFTGSFDFSREAQFGLTALQEVLRLRLREVLREDLGGTYGVWISAAGWRDPRPRYQVSIGFGADADRLEELTAVLFAELESIREHGPSASHVAKVQEMLLRAHETEMRQNYFWLSQILGFDQHGWPLEDIAGYESMVRALTAETVLETARRHLDAENFIQVSLLPESKDEATPTAPERKRP